MSIELACLYYEVHSRFHSLPIDTYCDAMDEISRMASKLSHNMNDLAKVVNIH